MNNVYRNRIYDSIYIDYASKNVGVGVTNPTEKFEVGQGSLRVETAFVHTLYSSNVPLQIGASGAQIDIR